ncbi:hypothetical protein dqs_0667 [Azoarcus olearius]|uniref:hypothetical protein n=1 Tax=Azoarcus sp. (strain BH72) TaxID=418699 RepID=UPI0008060C85|nr:hypothetical protein [Azoarcus olearius]ANQ83742.1 hypothetical protein dqs_0667 [Azoarcus olearius]
MRSAQVLMFCLCVIGGLFLLVQAPSFFMPDRWDPAVGRAFGPLQSRLLGAALLAIAWLGLDYLRNRYYSETRQLPGVPQQRRYFAVLVLALALLSAAFNLAPPGPNPDYRPPASAR